MNPTRVYGALPGQWLFQGFVEGTMRILIVEQDPEEGLFVGHCTPPTEEEPFWHAPRTLLRVQPDYLKTWSCYGVIDDSGRFVPRSSFNGGQ